MMGLSCGRFGFLFMVGFVCLAYMLYSPNLPDDLEDHWKIQATLAVVKCIHNLGKVCKTLGIGSQETIGNFMVNFLTSLEDTQLTIEDTELAGISVRMYTPKQKAIDPSPAIVYFHGGGWTLGSPASSDYITRRIAKSLNITVISVGYRLAPEHPFPSAFLDCVDVTKHVMENSAKLGLDPKRIAVAGDSAGGNLAAAVSQHLRDTNQLLPKLQVLISPVLQALNIKLPSYETNTKFDLVLTREFMSFFINSYMKMPKSYEKYIVANQHFCKNTWLKYKKYISPEYLPESIAKDYVEPETSGCLESVDEEVKGFVTNPYFSPLMADDLSGLSEAYIIIGGYDVLRDEALIYAKRLELAGVRTTTRYYPKGFHVDAIFAQLGVKQGELTMRDLVAYLKKNL